MYTYTHLRAKQIKKEKLIEEIIKLANACGKDCKIETLHKYDEKRLYNKYLKFRNEYILFYQK